MCVCVLLSRCSFPREFGLFLGVPGHVFVGLFLSLCVYTYSCGSGSVEGVAGTTCVMKLLKV